MHSSADCALGKLRKEVHKKRHFLMDALSVILFIKLHVKLLESIIEFVYYKKGPKIMTGKLNYRCNTGPVKLSSIIYHLIHRRI